MLCGGAVTAAVYTPAADAATGAVTLSFSMRCPMALECVTNGALSMATSKVPCIALTANVIVNVAPYPIVAGAFVTVGLILLLLQSGTRTNQEGHHRTEVSSV